MTDETRMRGLQVMLQVMVPGKIKKGQGFQTHVSKSEGWVHKLERGLQGEDERHGQDWDIDQHGSTRSAEHHHAARRQAQRVQNL